jgi:hypothetical protein
VKKSFVGTTLATLLCGLLVAAAVAEKAHFTVVGKPGEVLQYRMEQQQEINIQGMTITVNMSGDIAITALEQGEDENPRFLVRFENFEASLIRGGDMSEQDPRLNGVALKVTLSPRGEVLDVAPQTNLSGDRKDELENLVENFFAYLPEGEASPGDTWTRKRYQESRDESSDAPAVDGSTEFTLEEFEKKDGKRVAKIFSKGSALVNLPTPGGTLSGSTEGEAELLVALDGGHLVYSKASSEFSGTLGASDVTRAEYLEVKLKK